MALITTSTIISPHIPVTKRSIARLQKSDMTEPVTDMTMRRRGAINSSTRTTLKLRANLNTRRERKKETLPAISLPSVVALVKTSIKDWTTSRRSKRFHALSWLQKKYSRWTQNFMRSSTRKNKMKATSATWASNGKASALPMRSARMSVARIMKMVFAAMANAKVTRNAALPSTSATRPFTGGSSIVSHLRMASRQASSTRRAKPKPWSAAADALISCRRSSTSMASSRLSQISDNSAADCVSTCSASGASGWRPPSFSSGTASSPTRPGGPAAASSTTALSHLRLPTWTSSVAARAAWPNASFSMASCAARCSSRLANIARHISPH
mmetsp:Transcript_12804/g.36786  ORF Transcript_12804/g.36786 Transcript_12804/m.36786 type:complete len:328 (+) Transcript_12804:799-1782(+)